MSELGERDELPLAHLSVSLLDESALFGSEHVVRINHAPGLDEHTVLLLGECHKIPLMDVEGFEHLPRNDHLPPLAYAADALGRCGGLYSHTIQIIRLSEYVKRWGAGPS